MTPLRRVCLLYRPITLQLHNDYEDCLEHAIINPTDVEWGWIQFEGVLPGSSHVWIGIAWDQTVGDQKRGTRSDGVWSDGSLLFEAVTSDVSFVKAVNLPKWATCGVSFVEAIAIKYLSQISGKVTTGIKFVSRAFSPAAVSDETVATDAEVPAVSSLWDVPEGTSFQQEFRLVGFAEHQARHYTPDKLLQAVDLSIPNSIVAMAFPGNDLQTSGEDRLSFIRKLCEEGAVFQKLRSLDLSNSRFLRSTSELLKIMALCPKLEELNLSYNSALVLDDSPHQGTVESVSKLTLSNVARLPTFLARSASCFSLNRLLTAFPNIRSLELTSNCLTASDFRQLFESTENRWKVLNEVDLGFNNLSNITLEEIVTRLPPSVERLYLTSNQLKWLPEYTSPHLSPCSNIKSLSLTGCNIANPSALYWICTYLPNLENLRCLNNPLLGWVSDNPQSAGAPTVRMKLLTFLPNLRLLNGEEVTSKVRSEAYKYTLGLMRNGQDFINQDTQAFLSPLVRHLISNVFTSSEIEQAFHKTGVDEERIHAQLFEHWGHPLMSYLNIDASKAKQLLADYSLNVVAQRYSVFILGETKEYTLSFAPNHTTVEELKLAIAAIRQNWSLMGYIAVYDLHKKYRSIKDQPDWMQQLETFHRCQCVLKDEPRPLGPTLDKTWLTLEGVGLLSEDPECALDIVLIPSDLGLFHERGFWSPIRPVLAS